MLQVIKIIFFMMSLFLLGCNRALDPVSSPTLSKEALSDQEIVSELYTLQQDYIQKLGLLEKNSAEAESLQKSYRASIRNTLPDLHNAVSLAAVEQLDDNTLLLDKDMLLPLDTFKGAMELLILDALASGRDVEQLQHIMAEEAAKDTLQDRAVYSANVSKWPIKNGKYHIPYRFGTIVYGTDVRLYKGRVRAAMDIWEEASANRIKFVETDFSTLASETKKLTINFDYFYSTKSRGVLGNAHVGAYNASVLNLFRYKLDSNELLILSAALHELGHVLGFKHEHQRGDRNNYVEVNSSDSTNYGLLPLYGEFDAWSTKTFTLPNGEEANFDIPPPVGEGGKNLLTTYVTSPYDYLSIMHHNGLVVKVSKQGYQVGEKVARNYVLSNEDKKGVRLLYPPLS